MITDEQTSSRITETFLVDPLPAIDAAIGPGGVLERLCLGSSRPLQVEICALAAAAAQRGAASPGKVIVAFESAPHLGRTLAVALVALMTGVATGRSAVLLTGTVAAGETVRRGGSVHVAADLVESLTGRRPGYAVRLPLMEFASPSRCRRAADLADGRGAATAAAALRRLADLAEAAAADVAILPNDASPAEVFCAVEPALIATWREHDPDGAAAVDAAGLRDLTVDGRSPSAETLPHRALERTTVGVDLVVTSHAALYEELGGFSARPSNAMPFSIAVIDEAERLVDRGARVWDLNVEVGSLLRDVAALSRAIDADSSAGQVARDAAGEVARLGRSLSATLAARVASYDPSEAEREATQANAWLAIADALRSTVASAIPAAQPALDAELAQRISLGLRRLDEAVGAARADPEESPRDRVFVGRQVGTHEARITMRSPTPAGLLRRLWSRYANEPFADAIVLTGSTLREARTSRNGFDPFLRSVGFDVLRSPPVQHDLMRAIEPKRFGDARFVVASPTVADPTLDDEGSAFDPRWLAVVASAIAEALQRPCAGGSCHVVVATSSHDETDAILGAVDPELAALCIVGRRGIGLVSAVERFRARSRAVLIGADLDAEADATRGIDHLVVSRLPFPRVPAMRRPRTHAPQASQIRPMFSRIVQVEAMRRLRRAICAPFQSADASATIWILDPRLEPPAAVGDRFLVIGRRLSGDCLNAVPSWHFWALEDAELWPPVPRPGARTAL